jgi:hypothetical protein
MITIDLTDLRRLEKDLEKFKERAVPYAIRNSLNTAAFEGRRLWLGEMSNELVLRNTWTKRQVKIEKASGVNVRSMAAVLGSEAPFMDTQEFGGRRSGGGRHGMPIPTSVAAGQGMGAQPRTRLVRGANKLGAIQLTTRGRGKGHRRQRNASAIQQALKTGSKFVFLELESSKGIFKISGGRRKPQIRMIWDISRRSVVVPPHPTLGPALKTLEGKMPDIHHKAFLEQLKRHGVFGY